MIAFAAVLAALPFARPAATLPPHLEPPPVVRARYEKMLAAYRPAKIASFTYVVEQDGLHGLDQTHRIYRSGNDERDETLAVDGKSFASHPVVRIIRGRRDRYAVRRLAPLDDRYTFRFERVVPVGHHFAYRYRTTPKVPSAFTVDAVVVDGLKYLPLAVEFTTRSGKVTASGTIEFAASDRYWVPTMLQVQADEVVRTTREKIVWFSYRFPSALPRSTFAVPPPIAKSIPSI